MQALPSRLLLAGVVSAIGGGPLAAQALPTAQPTVVQIYREQVKVGHEAAHVRTERAWPAAYARAKSPDYYLAMESLTGRPEVWYISPWTSYTAWGAAMARDRANPTLRAELDQAAAADAAHVDGYDIIDAVAREDLSHGAFPDLNRMRFWQIAVWRVRPGHDAAFAAATAAYKKLVDRTGSAARWRTYQVTGGMPQSTYLIFVSFESFGEFDAMWTGSQQVMQAATPDEAALFERFFKESIVVTTANKYRLSPDMSYVSAETKATDPAFWK